MKRPIDRYLLSLCAVALVAMATCGGDAPHPTLAAGAYAFPDDLDMHYPVLVLDAKGAFGFVADAEETLAQSTNRGTWTQASNTLTLVYTATECCQFADCASESLGVVGVTGAVATVVFRGERLALRQLGNAVETSGRKVDRNPERASP